MCWQDYSFLLQAVSAALKSSQALEWSWHNIYTTFLKNGQGTFPFFRPPM